MIKEYMPKRFWRKVSVGSPDECWMWNASKDICGYGTFQIGVKSSVKAHRLSWQFHNGRHPGNMNVCHHCDRPACVNPAHLFLGTQKDNMEDMSKKGRHHDVRGEAHHLVKITNEQVLELRRRVREGESATKVGKEFGICKSTACRIANRTYWGHVSSL